MPFVLETGAGLSNATSYASVEEADDYVAVHAPQSAEQWLGYSVFEKQARLMRGTRAIELWFSEQFEGRKRVHTQALSFPRYHLYDSDDILVPADVVPERVKHATIEAALRDDHFPSDHAVKRTSVKLGPISESIEYSSPRSESGPMEVVRRLLSPYLGPLFTIERA